MTRSTTTDQPAVKTDSLSDALDSLAHTSLARLTRGVSPVTGLLAWYDWVSHLAISPGKQRSLLDDALNKQRHFAQHALRTMTTPHCENCIEPLEQDRRFSNAAWQQWPFNLIHQGFLLQQQWWHNATTNVRGVTRHHENLVSFAGRQWLDMFSPVNFPWTNPEVLQATAQTGGINLWNGAMNYLDDIRRQALDEAPAGTEAFVVGKDVAVTPGKVVYRNQLIELIQYAPATPKVHATPILIVPSWIMKYYILDLSPHNSMVKYLVSQGHTVFIISWKNPGPADRNLGMEDYRRLGVMDALDAVTTIVPEQKVNAVGYCLGGTLLSIAAAAMARDGDKRLNSLTLLAASVDFREPGELSLFIDESQLAWLESVMWDKGYLDGHQMAGAFQLLNSSDLIWSRRMREYLLGERQEQFDLMAWNADTTRMPFRMHSEYLRRLYLNNDLAEGRYIVDGKPVMLNDIRVPVYAVGTVRDHVTPWQSAYKIHHLISGADISFVLTSGGHNAGVVSPPDHPRRTFQAATRKAGEQYTDPQSWRTRTPLQKSSWWPNWQTWLAEQSAGQRTAPPPMGGSAESGYAAIHDAPGLYVRQR
ncbi:MAG TPA: alpha/beta fold hydrolase [Burkholderiaceae bacterium]|nr:alpha/beta fold hydrolase [Burkholderiaceae bacterium]